jgi:hypothetical protein
MTKEAFETIKEGLQRATIVRQRDLIRNLSYELRASIRANNALAVFMARHGKRDLMEMCERVEKLLEQARKELE